MRPPPGFAPPIPVGRFMRMAVLMMVFMAVGMIPVCVRFAHNPFTTLAAAQAAPYPLSIFMIPTPGAQLESILANAAVRPAPHRTQRTSARRRSAWA